MAFSLLALVIMGGPCRTPSWLTVLLHMAAICGEPAPTRSPVFDFVGRRRQRAGQPKVRPAPTTSFEAVKKAAEVRDTIAAPAGQAR